MSNTATDTVTEDEITLPLRGSLKRPNLGGQISFAMASVWPTGRSGRGFGLSPVPWPASAGGRQSRGLARAMKLRVGRN